MRKIVKLKFGDDEPKYRRSAIQPRFRGGFESYSPQSYMSYESKCSPSSITEISTPCSDTFPRSIAGTEMICKDEISIDHMSEEVVQVVEELMEQTSILKKRLVEMIANFHQKICRCKAYGPITPPVTSGCSCKPSHTPCPPEMSIRRFSAGRGYCESSGYESGHLKEHLTEAPNHEIQGFSECLCTPQNQCYTSDCQATAPIHEPRRSCLANANGCTGKSRKTQRFSEHADYFPDNRFSGQINHDGEKRTSRQSNYSADKQFSEGINFPNDERDRSKAGGPDGHNESKVETPAEMSKKLADAQKQIENLRCLIKKFVTCNCPKDTDPKKSDKATNQLLNQADSIQALLNGIRSDSKANTSGAKPRMRSGAEQDFADPDMSSSKETTLVEALAQPDERKPEMNARRPNVLDIGNPANSDKKVDSSIREVNTIKQNDVVYSADGRVLKTIAKLKRTEIVEGANPPSTDTTIPEGDANFKSIAIKTTAQKQGNKNIATSSHLHKTDQIQYLSRKVSEEAITRSESSETHIGKKRKVFEQRSHFTEKKHKPRLHTGYDKGFTNTSPLKHRRKHCRKKIYSSDSLPSTSEGHRMPYRVTAVPHVKSLYVPPQNNEEYIIREYIYPREGKKQKLSTSTGAGTTQLQLAPSQDVRIASQTVSLLGCKFFNKMHQPPSTLNLGGKADSYFIEVQPKKSYSFHGISSRHDFPQKRTSSMNYTEIYKRENTGRATAGGYYPEAKADVSKATNESFPYPRPFYSHKSSQRQQEATEVISSPKKLKETAKSSSGQARLDVSVKGVSINQIPYIIKQLGGKRAAKDFFVSVLPVKKPYKNFRVNVIDKETGNLLGYFFVDEEVFHEARSKGVFDSYLSLFVLNSLASFTDFVSIWEP